MTKTKIPKAIICDIDGTLSHMVDRGPFDWHSVGSDKLDDTVAWILWMIDNHPIDDIITILVSGRDGVCKQETKDWLKQWNIHYDYLFMRPDHNNEKDTIIKKRIYDDNIRGKFEILFVLDDRDQVVRMWREQGLKCLQVAEGKF
jgi:hypothetical protein